MTTPIAPADGAIISIANGKLTVPDNPIIPFIEGDGIGPEIVDSALAVLDALGAPFDWDRQPAGLAGVKSAGDPLPQAALASIRGTGPHRFDADYGATSSMTAVLGRMATYSGQQVPWDDAVRSELQVAPERYALDADPPVHPHPDGSYDAALPGVTRAF